MTGKLKVYELAKELGVEAQHLLEVTQRLGVKVKGITSILGTEESRTVREYFKKNKPNTTKKEAAAATTSQTAVSEKRVGATVIRRRTVAKTPEAAPVVEPPVEENEVEQTAIAATPAEEPSVVVSEVAEAAEVVEAEEVPVEVAAAPVAPEKKQEAPEKKKQEAPPEPPKRRFFPSIVKRVSTESYLGEKVGPKVDRPKREITPKPAVKKPGTPGSAGAPREGGSAETGPIFGLKRVQEVEATPSVDATKEAGRRRMLERQNTVFKSSDFLKRELVHSTKKRKNAIARPAMKTQITTPAEHKRVVEMGNGITVGDLAKEMGQKAAAVIQKLMSLGVTAAQNQMIDFDTASLVGQEFNFEIKQRVFKEEDYVPALDLTPENLKARGPVVTIMGHVDHGKTSLLDAIRKTNVAKGEAGGITQHVGAYYVDVPKRGRVTFIDTPGHEAFTAMRARGAKVTDIVVLVVSATDGVMPQTLESVDHAKAAGVPIVVAVNKIDLPDANPDRIKQTLSGHGLAPEEWGGDTLYVPVSAKTGKGIDTLLDSILLQAEVLELKANYDVPARGTVVESRLDKNRGPLVSVLVQHGNLHPGDLIVCGLFYGKVRALSNDRSQRVDEASPGVPVEILGLPSVPDVGDLFYVVADEKTAKTITESKAEQLKRTAAESKPKLTLEEMLAQAATDKELRVILKADVQGSVEALRETITKLPSEKVKLKLLHASTGGVTESDIMLASASKAVVVGFNVRPDIKAIKLAERQGIEVRTYSIIYEMLDDLKKMLLGLVDKKVREKVIGRAEVRDIFSVPKVGTIAGSAVIDGKVQRGCFLRLLRENRIVYEGKISSLKRFKEDVKEVAQGFECGIGLENFNDLKLGDQFEAYIKEEIAETNL
jgi:translation initiation factor IF-2